MPVLKYSAVPLRQAASSVVAVRAKALELPLYQRWLLHLATWGSLTLSGSAALAGLLSAAPSTLR